METFRWHLLPEDLPIYTYKILNKLCPTLAALWNWIHNRPSWHMPHGEVRTISLAQKNSLCLTLGVP